jgi:peptidoglycan glycosyltransferase
VNRAILRLFALVVLLFAVLVGFTSRWTVFEAGSLRSNPLNRRQLLEQQRIQRGQLLAADGTVLARSVPAAGGVFRRTYPSGGLFAHAVGYSYITIGNAALERSRNDELTGQRTSANTILDQLRGRRRQGDDVVTTLDPKAQRVAISQLAGRKGAVVALDPRTGAVRAFASVPRYDPRTLARPGVFQTLSQDSSRSPLLDRVTQSGYPPGSSFKVVTAIAAIDSGRFTPSSTVNGDNGVVISGVPLNNDFNQSFGPVDLTTALTKSINTVWAQVAVSLGKSTMARYMDRLGFDSQLPLDLPSDELRPSGEFKGRRLLSPTSSLVDVGRMGIGQDKLDVTPLQMALVAAAVANRGRLMAPHLTDRVVDRDGRTVQRIGPRAMSQVMKPATAGAVGQMMSQVVQEGTGTAAALSGVQVAGKTGTAEIVPGQNVNQVWFIAFAPLDHPRVAVAATVERSDGFGGTVAAPIAKAVIESLLGGGG